MEREGQKDLKVQNGSKGKNPDRQKKKWGQYIIKKIQTPLVTIILWFIFSRT
jgi:hypothetical protein